MYAIPSDWAMVQSCMLLLIQQPLRSRARCANSFVVRSASTSGAFRSSLRESSCAPGAVALKQANPSCPQPSRQCSNVAWWRFGPRGGCFGRISRWLVSTRFGRWLQTAGISTRSSMPISGESWASSLRTTRLRELNDRKISAQRECANYGGSIFRSRNAMKKLRNISSVSRQS